MTHNLLFTLTSLVLSVAFAKEPYAFLPDTPKYVCDNLLLGAKRGESYDGRRFRFVKWVHGLRTTVEYVGLDEILARGTTGLLFNQNHSGLKDALNTITAIGDRTAVRPIMTADMTKGPVGKVLKQVVAGVNGFLLPNPAGGKTEAALSQAVVREAIHGLNQDDNELVFGSGALARSARERLTGRGFIKMIMDAKPDVRLILVRQRGDWGSDLGHGSPVSDPNVELTTMQILKRAIPRAIVTALGNGLFFMPRRKVTLEFFEPTDFPRHGTREEMNAYIERFYDEKPERRVFVKRFFWQFWKPDVEYGPEIDYGSAYKVKAAAVNDGVVADDALVASTLKLVRSTLNFPALGADQDLDAAGMNSLDSKRIETAIEDQFTVSLPAGTVYSTTRGLATIVQRQLNDPAAAASGVKPIEASAEWRKNPSSSEPVETPVGETVPEVIFRTAVRHPRMVISEDQIMGRTTFKNMIVRADALSGLLEELPGERIGIMLPALGGGPTLAMAAHLAGKVPVNLNFTQAPGDVMHVLRTTEAEKILIARAVFETLSRQYDLSPYMDRFVFVDDLKLKVAARLPRAWARFTFRPGRILAKTRRTPYAVILGTSGSEDVPKSVPLTHANILANVRDVTAIFGIKQSDRLLNFLPTFHSFGNLVQVLSGALAVPAAYSPKPDDASTLVKMIAAYRPSIIAGTPTLLYEIFKRGTAEDLASLEKVFAGAEKLKPHQIQLMKERVPNLEILEGYGATEMSPVIAVNPPGAAKYGTVGPALASVSYKIVDPNSYEEVKVGEQGVLMVRGPSTFPGYLDKDRQSPFVTLKDNLSYYNTGDVVKADEDGYITILGRLKRFGKVAGEMVSFPALEAALDDLAQSLRDGQADPLFAVDQAGDNEPITLFTRIPEMTEERANQFLRGRSAPGTWMIRKVIVLDELPQLGTGKADGRALKEMLR